MPKIDTNLIPNGQKGNKLFASIPSLDFNLREHLLRFCNSYERLPAILKTFRDFKKKQKTAEWFRILGEEWSSCDNVGLYAKKIKSIFSANQRHWVEMMNEKEHKLYDALPKKIVLYRGAGEKKPPGIVLEFIQKNCKPVSVLWEIYPKNSLTCDGGNSPKPGCLCET